MMRDQANKIWQNIETNISPRRYVEANKHLKIYSTTLAIREIQNKTVGDIPLTCIKIAETKKKKKNDHTKCRQGCRGTGTLIHGVFSYTRSIKPYKNMYGVHVHFICHS